MAVRKEGNEAREDSSEVRTKLCETYMIDGEGKRPCESKRS